MLGNKVPFFGLLTLETKKGLALGLVHLSPFHHTDFCKKFIAQEPSGALELFAAFMEKVQAKPTQAIL